MHTHTTSNQAKPTNIKQYKNKGPATFPIWVVAGPLFFSIRLTLDSVIWQQIFGARWPVSSWGSSPNDVQSTLSLQVTAPKRVKRGKDLHISPSHHKPPKPGFLARGTYVQVFKRLVLHYAYLCAIFDPAAAATAAMISSKNVLMPLPLTVSKRFKMPCFSRSK